ncbi:MAG: hypothetical protein MUE41_19160 [Gemmatimonadaceae bacterium]|jgi:hypothetical protein|nr:hypothetical protein [Gemmatimonadaceae bacterium]
MKSLFRSKRIESIADQLVHEWAEFIALPSELQQQPPRAEPRDTEREFTAHPLRFVDG